MAVADDFPFLDDPRRLVGLASYRLTADEFRAGARADLATRPWNRSWSGWLAFHGFWHALLAVSAWVMIAWALGVDGPFGPVGGEIGFLAAVEAGVAAFVLGGTLYGVPTMTRRKFREFPGAGEEHAFAFTPDRWMLHGPLGDSSLGWEFLRDVAEYDDGFAFRLKLAPGTFWLPGHALAGPFDRHAAAELFRSKVPNYRVVQRRVGGPEGTLR